MTTVIEPGMTPYVYTDEKETEPLQPSTCEVYRLNPDGTKGEHLRTDPAFPDGWTNTKFNISQKRRKEVDEVAARPRKEKPDNEEIIRAFEECDKKISPFARRYSIGWNTAKEWLREAGAIMEKPHKENKPEWVTIPTADPEPEFTLKEHWNPEPEKHEEIEEANPVDELKLKFIAEVLQSRLNEAQKLSMIEIISVTM